MGKENKEKEEEIEKLEETKEALVNSLKRADNTIRELEDKVKQAEQKGQPKKREIIAVGDSNLKRMHPKIQSRLKDTHNVEIKVAYTTDEANKWIDEQTAEMLKGK